MNRDWRCLRCETSGGGGLIPWFEEARCSDGRRHSVWRAGHDRFGRECSSLRLHWDPDRYGRLCTEKRDDFLPEVTEAA